MVHIKKIRNIKSTILKRKREPKTKDYLVRECLLAVDVETTTEGDFILAHVFGEYIEMDKKGIEEKVSIDKGFEKNEDLHSFLLGLSKESTLLIFFNLDFDFKYMEAISDPDKLLADGSRIYTFSVVNNGIQGLDIRKHSLSSLEKWIKILDMEKKYGITKNEVDFSVKPDLELLKTRCRNDAKATWYLGRFIQDFYLEECKIPLKLTVGGAALELFIKHFFSDFWYRPVDERVEFERAAYYGGRTECLKRGKFTYKSYDINSCYLSIMATEELPNMRRTFYSTTAAGWELYWQNGRRMILDAEVEVPSLQIPPLPYREKGKLYFPWGRFRGCWTDVELRHAVSLGTKILKVHRFILYIENKPYFREFSEFVWGKRIDYRRSGNLSMDNLIKTLGNSIYGKFGEMQREEEILGADEFYLLEEGEREFYEPDLIDGDLCYKRTTESPTHHTFPGIAAFITAFARVKLHKAMLANLDNLLYTDTDCIKLIVGAKPQMMVIGDGLGEWTESEEMDGVFYASKYYGDKCKGLSRNAVLIDNEFKTKTYRYYHCVRAQEARKSKGKLKQNQFIERIKTINNFDTKRLWPSILSPEEMESGELYLESAPVFVDKKFKEPKFCERCDKFTQDYEYHQQVRWEYKRGAGHYSVPRSWRGADELGSIFIPYHKPQKKAVGITTTIYCLSCLQEKEELISKYIEGRRYE